MCSFSLFRNMWGLLATSHAPIAANDNLSNKPYFCLVLWTNLSYQLIPVDYRSIILGHFDIVIYYEDLFSTSRYGIPLGIVYGCFNKTKFIWLLCINNSLTNRILVKFRVRLSLTGRIFLYVWFILWLIIILWSNACLVSWSFSVFFLKIRSEPSIIYIIILWCADLWSALHKICPIWGDFAFPHEWDCG